MDCDLNPGPPECDKGASAVRLWCPVRPSVIFCATRSVIVVLFGVVGLVKSWGRGGSRAEHAACVEEKINAFRVWVGNPEGKTQLGSRRDRCQDRRMILKWIIIGRAVGSCGRGTDKWPAVVDAVVTLGVPQGAVNVSTNWEIVTFWTRAQLPVYIYIIYSVYGLF